MSKLPYEDRDDIERLKSQWRKLNGQAERKESSAAIVRCATAVEIAANIAIRQEFLRRGAFDLETINGFLIWANGISNKMTRLLLPLVFNRNRSEEYRRLETISSEINTKRNAIVHSGFFATKLEAKGATENAREFIQTLVRKYHPEFELPRLKKKKKKKKKKKNRKENRATTKAKRKKKKKAPSQ